MSSKDATQRSINEIIEHCVKLASDNRISARNTWELDLIDHLDEAADYAFSQDTVGPLRLQTAAESFRVATGSLDASIKIYASRVDDTLSVSQRVAAGLAVADINKDETQQAAKKSRRMTQMGTEHVTGPTENTVQETELDFRVDAAAAVVMSGDRSIFTNQMRLRQWPYFPSLDPVDQDLMTEVALLLKSEPPHEQPVSDAPPALVPVSSEDVSAAEQPSTSESPEQEPSGRETRWAKGALLLDESEESGEYEFSYISESSYVPSSYTYSDSEGSEPGAPAVDPAVEARAHWLGEQLGLEPSQLMPFAQVASSHTSRAAVRAFDMRVQPPRLDLVSEVYDALRLLIVDEDMDADAALELVERQAAPAPVPVPVALDEPAAEDVPAAEESQSIPDAADMTLGLDFDAFSEPPSGSIDVFEGGVDNEPRLAEVNVDVERVEPEVSVSARHCSVVMPALDWRSVDRWTIPSAKRTAAPAEQSLPHAPHRKGGIEACHDFFAKYVSSGDVRTGAGLMQFDEARGTKIGCLDFGSLTEENWDALVSHLDRTRRLPTQMQEPAGIRYFSDGIVPLLAVTGLAPAEMTGSAVPDYATLNSMQFDDGDDALWSGVEDAPPLQQYLSPSPDGEMRLSPRIMRSPVKPSPVSASKLTSALQAAPFLFLSPTETARKRVRVTGAGVAVAPAYVSDSRLRQSLSKAIGYQEAIQDSRRLEADLARAEDEDATECEPLPLLFTDLIADLPETHKERDVRHITVPNTLLALLLLANERGFELIPQPGKFGAASDIEICQKQQTI